MAEVIYVVNPGGYIGSSTRKEIEYAKSKGKYIVLEGSIKTLLLQAAGLNIGE